MARFKLLEGNINIGEYASKYVFKAIMPCLHEIFIKRGNNLPVNKYHDVLNNIIQMIYSFNNIAQSNEDK